MKTKGGFSMAQNRKGKTNVWRGLTTITASLLALSITATPIVDGFRTDIDKFIGTSSTKIVTSSSSKNDNRYTYKSDYKNTKELLTSIQNLGEKMNEEGSVLLKNDGALPLSSDETKKVSLLGFSSYYPVQGGDMGSSLSENKGTDADTVDMVQAFTAKGFKLNSTLENVYSSLKSEFTTEVATWGGTASFTRAVAPSTTGYFTSLEPSTEKMDGVNAKWRDSLSDDNVMIVTIARAAGENHNYTPGKAGVDPSQNLNQTDPLGLSDTERAIIKEATDAKKSNNGKVIVLLNNASAMQIDELAKNDDIDAMLEIGLPGAYGFYGVADVLSGEANPSGHLSDTYVVDNAKSPAAQNYGNFMYTNADEKATINSEEVEAESIYTGYKYYETRYADSVLGDGNAITSAGSSTDGAWNYSDEVTYPFGYGLSYTSFDQTLDNVSVDLKAKTVTATVTVTNTGDVAGKDVVEFYTSVPYTDYDKQNKVEKSAIQLLDYGKTKNLKPGESQTVTIVADAQNMASWDSNCTNVIGTKGTYILDNGDYYFSVGNGAHEALNNILSYEGKTTEQGMTDAGDASKVQTWNLSSFDSTSFAYSDNGTALENQLQDADLNYYMPNTVTYLSRSDWSGTWPKTYQNLTATDQMIDVMKNGTYTIKEQGDPSSITFGADNKLTLADLKGDTDINDSAWGKLMDQITLEECMIRTAFGGTSTKSIASITSPEVIQNDGPNGFNSYPLGQYANTKSGTDDPCAIDKNDKNLSYIFGTMPSETVIAQTFSKDIAAEYGKAVGNYSLWSNLTILWAAGTNLHRTPYNARNHEYYSEDAVLTAGEASAFIKEGKVYGCIIAPKHFAYNDTEINRSGISVFFTEQQARENELRGTEETIEKAGALGVMTAFNRIGVTAANAHYGLLMNILRKEWGFKGLVSEDFIMDTNYASLKDAVHCGVTMLTFTGDNSLSAVSEKFSDWKKETVGKDATLMQDLKNNMLWQNYAFANSNALDGFSSNTKIVSVRTWYDNLITGLQIGFALLTILCIAFYMRNRKKKDEI